MEKSLASHLAEREKTANGGIVSEVRTGKFYRRLSVRYSFIKKVK